MAITYYMLEIPPYLLFALLVALGGAVSGLATLLFRKFVRVKIQRAHNEVTGFLFLAIASFYALLLSFVVLVVWDQLNETRNTVSKEGSSALGLYRDIKYYPDTLDSKMLMASYLDFVYNVIDDEFPLMAEMKRSRKTPESFDKVFFYIQHLHPRNPFEVQLVAEMFNRLNELASNRGLRLTSMESEISPPLWLPMILGAMITLLCAILMDIEHKRMHVGLSALLGAFICMFFFLIIILDHPYAGSLGIEPKSYLQIFTLEGWSEGSRPQFTLPK